MADGSLKRSRRALAPAAVIVRLRRSLEYLLTPQAQPGNGGRKLVPGGAFENMPAVPETDLDRTTATARRIIEADALSRSEKIAQLKAARCAVTENIGKTSAARPVR